MCGKTSLTVSAMASMFAMLSFAEREVDLACAPPVFPGCLPGTAGGTGEPDALA